VGEALEAEGAPRVASEEFFGHVAYFSHGVHAIRGRLGCDPGPVIHETTPVAGSLASAGAEIAAG
jgi:hypothetical protein